MKIISFWVDTVEEEVLQDEFEWETYAVLMCDGKEIWRGTENIRTRDKQSTATEIVIDKLKSLLA